MLVAELGVLCMLSKGIAVKLHPQTLTFWRCFGHVTQAGLKFRMQQGLCVSESSPGKEGLKHLLKGFTRWGREKFVGTS